MNEQVVSRCHNDLRGAILAKIPIDFGQTSGSTKSSLGGPADRKKLERLRDFDGDPSELPTAYSAGMRLYEQNVPADVVLDGLSWRASSRREIARVFSRTVLYMLVLSTVAVAGIAFHQFLITPTLNAFHEDLTLDADAGFSTDIEATEVAKRDRFQVLATTIAIAMFLLLAMMALIGPNRVANWFGGKQYELDRACLVSTRAARELIANQMTKDQAIRIASDLVGDIPSVNEELTTAVDSLDDPQDVIERFDSLTRYYRASASDRLVVLHSLVPTTMVTLIGGLVALTYGIAIFQPLVRLINRLSETM